jgi:hypothetical protein
MTNRIFGRRWLLSKTAVVSSGLNRFNRAVGLPVTVPGTNPVDVMQHAKAREKFEK